MNFTIPEKQKVGHHVVSSGVNSGTAGGKAVYLSRLVFHHKDLLFPANFKELLNILQHGVQHTPKDGRDLKT